MQRNTRQNSTAPDIFPNVNPPRRIMVDAAAPAAVLVPPVAPFIAMESWSEISLMVNFNPGTTAGQKMFLEKTKGLPQDQCLTLTGANPQKIMNLFKLKEQLMGAVVTCTPSVYTLGVPSTMMNLICESLSLSLEMTQRAAFTHFSTALGDGFLIQAQPWIAKTLDPANNAGDKNVFVTG